MLGLPDPQCVLAHEEGGTVPAADETYLRAVVRDLRDGRRDEVLAVHVAPTAHRGGLPRVTGHRLVEVPGQLRQGRGVVGGFVEAAHQGGDPGDGVQPLAAYVTDEQAHAVRRVLRRVEITSDGCRGGRRLVTDRDPGLPPPGPHGREHGALGALRHPLGSLEPAPQRQPQPAQGDARPGEDHHGDVVDHRVTAVGRQVPPKRSTSPARLLRTATRTTARSAYTQAAIMELRIRNTSPLNAPGVGRSTASASTTRARGARRAHQGSRSLSFCGACDVSPVVVRYGLTSSPPGCSARTGARQAPCPHSTLVPEAPPRTRKPDAATLDEYTRTGKE